MQRAVSFIIFAAVPLLLFISCGGRDTVAERSAAAYRDALEKRLPIEDDHGGHGAEGGHVPGGSTDPASHEEHGAAGAGDHAMAGHGDASDTAGDHAMPGMTADGHAAAGHGAAEAEHPVGHAAASAGAHDVTQHGATQHEAAPRGEGEHGAMQHDAAQHDASQHGAARPGEMQHGAAQHDAAQEDAAQHGEMQHGASGTPEHGDHSDTSQPADAHSAIPPGGLWGRVPGSVPARPAAAPALPMAPVPATNDEMKRLRPDATLAPDPADTPAAISVQEAKKAAGEGDHSAHPPDHSQHDANEDDRP